VILGDQRTRNESDQVSQMHKMNERYDGTAAPHSVRAALTSEMIRSGHRGPTRPRPTLDLSRAYWFLRYETCLRPRHEKIAYNGPESKSLYLSQPDEEDECCY
jgi:hypothetical protein